MNQILLFASDVNSIQAWVSIAQLLITIGTAVLIISTFRLQAETFKEQQEITKIEQKRFKLEIKPSIKFELIDGALLLTAKNQDLINAKFEFFRVLEGVIITNLEGNFYENVTYTCETELGIQFSCPKVPLYSHLFDISITYEDLLGNKYNVYSKISKDKPVLSVGPTELQKKPHLTTWL